MTGSAPLSVAVIGTGRIGARHAENLARFVPGARLAAVADVNLPAAAALAERLGTPRVSADYRELLADSAITAVVICTPTDTHARLIAEAAAAGKHIFCEKPIDFDLARTDQALAAAAQAGVTLQIGFNRRFDPHVRRLAAAVTAGEIGAPHLLRITSRDPAPPSLDYLRGSGGLFLDMAIHDFDLARHLLGEVVEAHATGAVLVDPAIGALGDIDTAVTVLRFASGALGTIDNSRRAVYGYDQRVEVFGAGGQVTTRNVEIDNVMVSDGRGRHAAKPLYFFLERYGEALVAELQAFVAAVQQGRPAPVSGADGRAAVVIGLAAKRSLAEGRPVRVAEIG
ncbi:MAG: inositol 2-dehydrogenase [Anaerolineales bacterium]|nr:inositol 2-dehydrogenase [Anaerolineales bacterium]